ncbi:MAG: hypothetical protein GY909_15195 [Oligoflexia bacterium]|nr:hypothetical protein [Oligoflexia bacterium]
MENQFKDQGSGLFLREGHHAKRLHCQEIQSPPTKKLTKTQRERIIKYCLKPSIRAYKRKMIQMRILEQYEMRQATQHIPNFFVDYGDFEHRFSLSKFLAINENIHPKTKSKAFKLLGLKEFKANEVDLPYILQKEYEDFFSKKKKYTSNNTLKEKFLDPKDSTIKAILEERLGKAEAKLIIKTRNEYFKYSRKLNSGKGIFSEIGDDIGGDAVSFFYSTLDRFDISEYEGKIGKVNYEGAKTKKTLEFFFISFFQRKLDYNAIDSIRWQRERGLDAPSRKTKVEHIDETLFLEERTDIELADIKLDVFKNLLKPKDRETQKYILQRVYCEKKMLQDEYEDQFDFYEEEFQIFKEDCLRNLNIEIDNYQKAVG